MNRRQILENIPIEKINILNPRERNRKIANEIKKNIEDVGLKRPITVSRRLDFTDGKEYDLVCGQGHLEAYIANNQTEIPAIIIDADEEETLIMSLVENIARRNYSPTELLQGIKQLKDIRHKKNLLKGICEEVVEMLKDKIVSSKVFYYLARMKPERQIEATKIMVESKTFTSSFARSIWLATSDEQLAVPRRQQRPAVTDFSHFTKLEEEINRLHGEYEEIEENYGLNVLNFTLVKGYVKTLVMNPRVNRYLRINNPDILEHLESIVDIDNLNTEE